MERWSLSGWICRGAIEVFCFHFCHLCQECSRPFNCTRGAEWDRGSSRSFERCWERGSLMDLYITGAVVSGVKNPESKGQAAVIDSFIVSREQWLQIASRSPPDKQVEREHEQCKSKDPSLKWVLPVMCTTASSCEGEGDCGSLDCGRSRQVGCRGSCHVLWHRVMQINSGPGKPFPCQPLHENYLTWTRVSLWS